MLYKNEAEDGEEAGPDAGLEPRVVMDFRAPLLIGHERRKAPSSGRGSLSTIWKPNPNGSIIPQLHDMP